MTAAEHPCNARTEPNAGCRMMRPALAYAARGCPVFPCRPDKRPATAHGFKDASADRQTILAWWTRDPGAMIGTPTGTASGLVAVDLDFDGTKGLDGPAAFAALVKTHGAPIRTRKHRTPRGGLHLVFTHPGEKVKSTTSALAPGVDTRGDGGYVILPPSENGAGTYTVETDIDPAPLPAWLIGLFRERGIMAGAHRNAPPTETPPDDAPDRTKVEAALRFVSADCPFDAWLRVGMALHSWNPAEGCGLWDAWSQTAPDRYEEGAIERHWRTFKPGAVTVATLFKLAIEAGWKPATKTTRRRSAPTREPPPELPASAAATEWTPAQASAPDKPNPIEAAKAGTPYAMTDLGNAERLVALHGDSIRWDVARKVWRAWTDRRWDVDAALRVNTLAAETARAIRHEAAAAPAGNGDGRDLGQDLFKHAVKSEGRDRLNAMIEVAKARPGVAVAADRLDADPWALNVLNGTLDLRTGTLRPHNRADLLTKLAPVEYRAGHRCERWERFLDDSTGGDADLIAFLQIVAGYTLTGDTSEEKLFLVYGPEAAGKSTFLDALRAVLGDYARTVSSDLLTKKREANAGAASPELAGLAGARLAAASEMEQGREIAEALAKNLTGGEPITARHLYAELFDFRPQFKLWLALNHCPKVSADDGAIWRRILRIGFEHTVPPEKRDKTLKPHLRDPDGGAPAVLAWAVEGCLRWQREGLKVPEAVKRSTAAYRQESDPLAAFMEDCLRFEPAAWTSWADIWTAYNAHAAEMGTGERYRIAPKRLQERLRGHDCQSERLRIGRGWRGVEIREGWQTGERDGSDACDTFSKTFLRERTTEKVYEVASQPSQASRHPDPEPSEMDFSAFDIKESDI